jgi:hypothetical protein
VSKNIAAGNDKQLHMDPSSLRSSGGQSHFCFARKRAIITTFRGIIAQTSSQF